MNPAQQPQARAKPCEDTMQELDAALRALQCHIAKLEKRIRIAMEQVNTVNSSIP